MPEGGSETLHLMSFGLVEVDVGGQSLPDLIEDLGYLLDGNDEELGPGRATLFEMVREYGGSGTVGYDHGTMSGWAVYQKRYAINFARLYSVQDPKMRLLTSTLLEQTFAVPASVTFELQLPEYISSFNPADNWQVEIAAMVTSIR